MLVKLLACVVILARLAGATDVMARWSPTLIVIGVDGKGTRNFNGRDEVVKSCKVLRSVDTAYIAAGVIPPKLKENVQRAEDSEAIKLSLQAERLQIQREEPARYGNQHVGDSLLTIFAASFTSKTVTLRLTRFVLAQDGTITVQPHIFDGDEILCLCPRHMPPPNNWGELDPTNVIKDTLTKIFENDKTSGPPITIVRVTPGKIELPELGNCEADGSNAWRSPQ
jgi:hypothetical protein